MKWLRNLTHESKHLCSSCQSKARALTLKLALAVLAIFVSGLNVINIDLIIFALLPLVLVSRRLAKSGSLNVHDRDSVHLVSVYVAWRNGAEKMDQRQITLWMAATV